MSDEDETPDDAEVETPKRKPRLILILGAAGAVLLIVAAVTAFLVFGKKKPLPEAKGVHEAAAEFGAHIDTADENAARAAALARGAADNDRHAAGNVPAPAAAEPIAKP